VVVNESKLYIASLRSMWSLIIVCPTGTSYVYLCLPDGRNTCSRINGDDREKYCRLVAENCNKFEDVFIATENKNR